VRLRVFCAATIATLLVAGCGLLQRDGVVSGSGRIISEGREVSRFSAVALQGSGDVIITQGAAERLTIEADDNIMPLITSAVDGGTLRLGFEPADWQTTVRPSQPVRYLLTLRQLDALELSGAGNFEIASLQTSDLALVLAGTGDVSIASLRADTLNASLAGAGTITLAGTVRQQLLRIAGQGNFEAGDLESRQAEVEVTGQGSATLWVRDSLAVRITGTGSVSYFGLPDIARREILGTGDINPLGDR
jgi:hypothetical protein